MNNVTVQQTRTTNVVLEDRMWVSTEKCLQVDDKLNSQQKRLFPSADSTLHARTNHWESCIMMRCFAEVQHKRNTLMIRL